MRGSGKSTWAAEQFAKATRINLLNESVFQAHLREARLFRDQLLALPSKSWVVVDEVQRLPCNLVL